MERRHLLQKPRKGKDRRRPRPAGYRDPSLPGVNAEDPKTEQDEVDLARQEGPDPRIPK